MSTKKNYKDVKENPALSYISQIHADKFESDREGHFHVGSVPPGAGYKNKDQNGTITGCNTQNDQLIDGNSLSQNFAQTVPIDITPTPEGFKIKPQYSEIKTRRVQLVFPPSLFRKVKARATNAHISVNEFVCLVLDAVVHHDPDPEE